MSESLECVQVVVRCRPLNDKEIAKGCKKVVTVDEQTGEITVGNNDNNNNQNKPSFYSAQKQSSSSQFPFKMFTFDKTFGENSFQEDIYTKCANQIIESVMKGYNGTIFAYGQTGTGKTYTMVGIGDDEKKGIIPRAFCDIFESIQNNNNDDINRFLVQCSFIEIYNDQIKDLLNISSDDKSLELREHPEKGVYIKDLCCMEVKNETELNEHFVSGNNYRHVGETAMNRDSSRSHSVFTIIIESVIKDTINEGKENIRVGKLHLVDLAGSERQSKTESKGMRFTEAININLSLSALGNVINSLTNNNKSKHIPYRDSKLTRILQDSLGGNSKTVMIANICSSDYNYDETLSTLRFANRAKHIKNKPHINQDPKDKLLDDYKKQIEELKIRLQNDNGNNDIIHHEQVIIPKIIIQKVHKIGISKDRVQRLYEKQKKEEENLKKKYNLEKKEWQQQTKSYLTQKIKNEKEIKYIEEEILMKKKIKKENIRKKLIDIERKLIYGEKMIDSAKKQEIELIEKKKLLANIKEKEEILRENYLKKHQKHLLLKSKYSNQEQELNDKKNKLKKLFDKYKNLCYNIENLQSSFQNKREEYLNIIRILNKKIKLKNTIIEYFIEPNQLQKLYKSDRIVLEECDNDNDDNDDNDNENEKLYKIKKLDLKTLRNTIKRPISCKQQRVNNSSNNNNLNKIKRIKPVCEWNRIQCVLLQNDNPRYRYENIIQLQLDIPERTTQDYYHV